jgi:threonine dehydrogenase-like Zn-dependent dehydrogenase
MPVHLLHRLPDTMSFEEGAVVEPAANVVHDVLERGRVEPNDTVVVLGPGPIGLMALMAARAVGAGQVIVVGATEDEETRLPTAMELGADAVIVAGPQDPVQRVMELTGGRGADLVVEASGSPKAIASTVGMVRRMGRIAAVGLPGRNDIAFPWEAAAWKVCTIIFNLSTGYTSWDRAIGLISAKKMNIARIITHVEPLQSWERAFEAIESKRGLKALLIP